MISQKNFSLFINECCSHNKFTETPSCVNRKLIIYGDANIEEKLKKINEINNKLIINYSYGENDVNMFDFSICKYLRNREYLTTKTFIFIENVNNDLVKEHGLYACFGTPHEYRHMFHMDRGCIDNSIYVPCLVFLVNSPYGFIDKTEIKRQCYFMEMNK